MHKKIIITILILVTGITVFGQSGSYPGAFSRMGIGARGMAMGNALVSDIFGDVSGYYNPALSCFQDEGIVNIGYTFLNLDRSLNTVSFAKKFSLQGGKQTAGISASWINAGVGDIDSRDNDARQLGLISTFENQFALGTGFVLSPNIAIGAGFKLYYSKLYEEVNTTSVALDLGMIILPREDLSIGLSVRDIGAKYKWETSKVYGSSGTITENKFPVLVGLGSSYKLPNELGVVSLMIETSVNPRFELRDTLGIITESDRTYNYVLKAGGEINLTGNLKLRAGIDRVDLSSDDIFGNIKPGLGIAFFKSFKDNLALGLNYSFQLEPYTKYPVQNLSVSFKFK